MLKTKSQLAEEIHDDMLKRLVVEEIDAKLAEQANKTFKHGSKEKIESIAMEKRSKDNIDAKEKVLVIIKRKITAYKAEEAK